MSAGRQVGEFLVQIVRRVRIEVVRSQEERPFEIPAQPSRRGPSDIRRRSARVDDVILAGHLLVIVVEPAM
jgi:hypothetical protein